MWCAVYELDGSAPRGKQVQRSMCVTATLETLTSVASESKAWSDSPLAANDTSHVVRCWDVPRSNACMFLVPALGTNTIDTGVFFGAPSETSSKTRIRIGVGMDGMSDDKMSPCANVFPVGTCTIDAPQLREMQAMQTMKSWTDEYSHCESCGFHLMTLYSRAPPNPKRHTHWMPRPSGILAVIPASLGNEDFRVRSPRAPPRCGACGCGSSRLRAPTSVISKLSHASAAYVDNITVTREIAMDVMRHRDVIFQSGTPQDPIDQIRFPPGFKRAVEAEYRSSGYTRLTEVFWINLARTCLAVMAPELGASIARGLRRDTPLPVGGHAGIRQPVSGNMYTVTVGVDTGPLSDLPADTHGSVTSLDWDIAPTVRQMNEHGLVLLAASMATHASDSGEYVTDLFMKLSGKGKIETSVSDNQLPFQAAYPPSGDCEGGAQLSTNLLRAMREFVQNNNGKRPATLTMQRIVDALQPWDPAILCLTASNASMTVDGGGGTGAGTGEETALETSTGVKSHIIAALLPRTTAITSMDSLRSNRFGGAPDDGPERDHWDGEKSYNKTKSRGQTRRRRRVPLFLDGTCWVRHSLPDAVASDAERAAEACLSLHTDVNRSMGRRYALADASAYDFYLSIVSALIPGEGYSGSDALSGDAGEEEYRLVVRSANDSDRRRRDYSGQPFVHGVDARAFVREYHNTVHFVRVANSASNDRERAHNEHVLEAYVASMFPAPKDSIDPDPATHACERKLTYAHRWCKKITQTCSDLLGRRKRDDGTRATTWIVRRRRVQSIHEASTWLTALEQALQRECTKGTQKSKVKEAAVFASAAICGSVTVTLLLRVSTQL